jgi:hypothetical protein
MAAKLSSGASANGVVAYQDHENGDQFHYWPARADLVLGDTLSQFEVTHWGVNENAYYVDLGGQNYVSSVGGILAGRARIDISDDQRQSITQAIKEQFNVERPRLLPLMLSDCKVTPVIAQNVIDMGSAGTVNFPSIVGPGSTFSYLVSATNSLFAHLSASQATSPVARPSFAMNVDGMVEFVGDPWTAEIKCDLSQVWSYTRSKFSAGARWGWIEFGGNYERIVQDLIRDNVIKVKFIEGSGTEGRQIFEVAKKIFEAINNQAVAGEGFFKFEPNPAPSRFKENFLFGWSPWSASINASYYSNTFRQSISFNEIITYTGRVKLPMGLSMPLAVGCSGSAKQYFKDLQDTSNGCVTQSKADGLQNRIRREVNAKQAKTQEYLRKLEDGEWTVEKWRNMMAILREITLTENLQIDASGGVFNVDGSGVIAEWERAASADFDKILWQARKKPQYNYS